MFFGAGSILFGCEGSNTIVLLACSSILVHVWVYIGMRGCVYASEGVAYWSCVGLGFGGVRLGLEVV